MAAGIQYPPGCASGGHDRQCRDAKQGSAMSNSHSAVERDGALRLVADTASKRRLANCILTATTATAFVVVVVFAQLLNFSALVQTCCGDGFKTEPFNGRWWSILA